MRTAYSDIDVIACVQGNTVRVVDSYRIHEEHAGHDKCVVYDFRNGAAASGYADKNNDPSRRRRVSARRKAARARARKVRNLRAALISFFLMVTIFSVGGIASRAKSKDVPEAYKYYDTITVAYQENLLDIVQRYDDRNYYETQNDYLEELCRINNLEYDETSYPVVTPGTHLVVPYYCAELK